MTDDQIRSRLREALTEDVLTQLATALALKHIENRRHVASQVIEPFVRDLLSAETQQIREERDELRQKYDVGYRGFPHPDDKLKRKLVEAEAEAQALRAALAASLVILNADVPLLREAGQEVVVARREQDIRELTTTLRKYLGLEVLRRLTPASPRTGEK